MNDWFVRSEPMPGVFELPSGMSVRDAINELFVIAHCSMDGEWEGQVRYLPLR